MSNAAPSYHPPPTPLRPKLLRPSVRSEPCPEREADGQVVDALADEILSRRDVSVRDLGIVTVVAKTVASRKRQAPRHMTWLDLFELAKHAPRVFDDLVLEMRVRSRPHR